MPAIRIDLTSVDMHTAGITGWACKKDAAGVLAKLRDRGFNVERCVDIHPAFNRFFRFWVIARPDSLAEMTWLMDDDGTWARGRLYDDTGGGALWVSLSGADRIPATITHNYGYSAGSEEVIDHGHSEYALVGGRSIPCGPRLQWFAKAWCVACSWSTTDTREEVVRGAARAHRAAMAR